MTDNTTDKTPADLSAIREKIDHIDQQLLTLFNERACCAEQVAKIKIAAEGKDAVFYRAEREAQVLKQVMADNPGPLSDQTIAFLFRELMSSCLALELPVSVAYLGPEGTFCQAAALKQFGHGAKAQGVSTIGDVFREVDSGAMNYGVVPVENSTEGMVNQTLDYLIDSNVKICGEVELRIHHHFLISDGLKPEDIDRVYTHQQSLGQCRGWLDRHFPNIKRIAVSSNAEGARLAANEKGAAAIASDIAGDIYGLITHSHRIEDNSNNCTRFIVIGHEAIAPSGKDKTSFVVSTRNKPGALYELLAPFHQQGLSLTRIETRPARDGAWAYVFFIDFEGHELEEPAQSVLRELENNVVELRRLGSYPQAVL